MLVKRYFGFGFRFIFSKNNFWNFSKSFSKLSYRHELGEEPLKSLTIGQMFEKTVQNHGDKKAIISCHENQKLSFIEVKQKVDKLASGLISSGLEKGDRLGIWAANQINWYITFLAAAKAGLILVTLNPMYQAPEIEYCLTKVGIKSIISDHILKNQNYYDILKKVIPDLDKSSPGMINSEKITDLKSVIVMSREKLNGTFTYDEICHLQSASSDQKLKEIEDSIDIDDPFNIQFTSGTTGQPKATVITHHGLVNNGYIYGKRNGLTQKDHQLCVQVPLFHAYGTGCVIMGNLPFGTTMVLPSPTYSPTKIMDALVKERCTIIYGTPSMYLDLVHLQKERNEILHLETLVTGSAPCSPNLFKQMKDVLKVDKIKSVYGLTEMTACVFQSLENETEETVTSTVGRLSDHLEAKVVDENNKIVPIGTQGELCLRGYSTMKGYWKDETKTKKTLDENNWFKTGKLHPLRMAVPYDHPIIHTDQFILEENGYGRIVGRLKDIIIKGGENIFPKEIEDFLDTHPDIIESKVIGVPHERLGEEILACVRIKKDSSFTLEDLQKYCEGKLAKFKIPKYLKIMNEFPKTTSGKIQKLILRQNVSLSDLL